MSAPRSVMPVTIKRSSPHGLRCIAKRASATPQMVGPHPRLESRNSSVSLFTTAAALISTLTKALAENRLEDKLKLYTVPRLLIIDEIGYLPIDRGGANLFFQLISRRYEKGPLILTSNQSFGAWGEVFGDHVIATAILDRVLHDAIALNIRGTRWPLTKATTREHTRDAG
jgi:DNA replication protein DnaC